MNFLSRQKKFQRTLDGDRLGGFVVTHPANLRYLCGYTGSNGLLLFLNGRRTFFTDGRYTEQAHEEVEGARVVISKGALIKDAAAILGRLRSAAIGFEADLTTVATAKQMRQLTPKRIRWKATSGLIMRQRLIKDADELKLIRAAVQLGAKVFEEALRSLKPGMSEIEVAGVLEYAARRGGADGMSFETIVAAGKRGALPHGRASSASIPRRGFVVMDSGVILRGYCSDMTRTVHVGHVGRQERAWYEAVLEAQLAGIAAVRRGWLPAKSMKRPARCYTRRSSTATSRIPPDTA